ncbi:hypothetical protein RHECIAT_CH0004360 [Rhizobium etli CIAT 652]|uniref:Uncharacterized protein n=1 Tax=Rhizobium etli (strain CIAT 652) TaxID=491916 RepID=B3PRZ7_RHIE6|nr:hypothetical protein RHECIAT_CH0004360 [Rhizobium etli CIAT 652]KKZ88804.1 hypothetical protein RPHASCH2410_CH06485 [Rhizobium phaseoli Ch24-10]
MTNITRLLFWPGIYPWKYNPICLAISIHAFMKRMAVPRTGGSAVLICLGKPATNHKTCRDDEHFRSPCR